MLDEQVGKLIVAPRVVAVIPPQGRSRQLVREREGAARRIIVLKGVAGDVFFRQSLGHDNGLLSVLCADLATGFVHGGWTPHRAKMVILVG